MRAGAQRRRGRSARLARRCCCRRTGRSSFYGEPRRRYFFVAITASAERNEPEHQVIRVLHLLGGDIDGPRVSESFVDVDSLCNGVRRQFLSAAGIHLLARLVFQLRVLYGCTHKSTLSVSQLGQYVGNQDAKSDVQVMSYLLPLTTISSHFGLSQTSDIPSLRPRMASPPQSRINMEPNMVVACVFRCQRECRVTRGRGFVGNRVCCYMGYTAMLWSVTRNAGSCILKMTLQPT